MKSKQYMILTPLPQLEISRKLPDYSLGDGLSIRPLEPQLRRSLLNLAKEHKCSDDCLQLLLESKSVFCAEIPPRGKRADGSRFFALFYMVIAQEIFKRILRCLLLFEWVPQPLFMYCWFLAAGSANELDTNTLKMLNPHWEYIDQFTNIDWRSGEVEPAFVCLGVIGLQQYWDKFSALCQVPQLKAIFTDEKKEKGLVEATNKYVKGKVEEQVKAKYGPDAFIGPDEGGESEEGASVVDSSSRLRISKETSGKWFLSGLTNAFLKERDKLSQELHGRVFSKRFDRAFQFFAEAFRTTEPHSFISFVTCLESLFCTSRSEITFQVASRMAWLLSPDDFKKRSEIFAKVKSLYNLRSAIVHGTKYSTAQIDEVEPDLIDLTKRAFRKILSSDNVYNLFRHDDQKICNKYLEGLNLGKIDPDTRSDRV